MGYRGKEQMNAADESLHCRPGPVEVDELGG